MTKPKLTQIAESMQKMRESKHRHNMRQSERLLLLMHIDLLAASIHECFDEMSDRAKGHALTLSRQLTVMRKRAL